MNNNWIFKINEYEKKIYSQSGQDGVIEFIFNKLQIKNKFPFCIEFGFNSRTLQDGSGANVSNLIINKGWKCLLLDGDYENIDINLHRHYLTSDTICGIFKLYNVPKEPEYISIDVDSTDLWLFKEILSEYSPMVVSVEYNAHFPINKAITYINDQNIITSNLIRGEKRRIYGASLKALKVVGEQFGYTLVYVVKGLDSFFIRNDLIKNCDILPLESFSNKVAINWHKPQKNANLINNFLDYDVYIKTGGDLEKSKEAAIPVCKKYILKKIK